MARTSSGRKGSEDTRSDPDLLTPLSATEHPEATAPADIRSLVEAIEELKVLVTTPSRSPDSDAEDFRQAAESVSTSIQALRVDLDQREEKQAESTRDLREAWTVLQKDISDLAAKLEAAAALGDALQAHAQEMRGMREGMEPLARFAESATAETTRQRQALEGGMATGTDIAALDAWRDDFLRHVNALLARVESEAGAPATGASAPEEATLAHVDRITARMALVESEVGKAMAKLDGAFGAVTTSLTAHGEAMRRAEASSLLTRKQVGALQTAIDKREREYRRLRHLWVSLPVILVVALAGMVLESRLHWFYRLLG